MFPLTVSSGTKKYLMGDEPCEEDCAVFGSLCQIVYDQLPGTVADDLVKGEVFES